MSGSIPLPTIGPRDEVDPNRLREGDHAAGVVEAVTGANLCPELRGPGDNAVHVRYITQPDDVAIGSELPPVRAKHDLRGLHTEQDRRTHLSARWPHPQF